ncbi:MAG: ribonuclease HI family protein [Actinomycetota bacterium]
MADAYRLHTDGGARGNPGPAGIGVVLESPEGEILEQIGRGIGWATNNVAEYEALIVGLQTARVHGAADLEVFMDSRLVTEQMKGNYKVKSPGLKTLYERARSLAQQFDRITFNAVPRAQNSHADSLSNRGMDDQAASGNQRGMS